MTPVTARLAPGREPWIVSPRVDGAFVIGAPFLVLAILAPLASIFSPRAIAFFVLGALALGHHLPGFLRVYGDPDLLRRHRFRFSAAPVAVFLATFGLAWNDLEVATLVLLLWGVWHFLMQVYGFMRIYAAKAGEMSLAGARLDWLICFTGFVCLLLWSPALGAKFSAAVGRLGMGGLTVVFSSPVRWAGTAAAVCTAVAYAVHVVSSRRRGRVVAPLKLLFLVVSLVFVSTSWLVAGGTLLLGLALYEACHDVQYSTIVWAYNRRLVDGGGGNGLLGAVFRGNGVFAIAYALLIVGYGCIAYVRPHVSSHALQVTVVAFIQTSTVLHYYFDGFIWKVRDRKTRVDLGLETVGSSGPVAGEMPDATADPAPTVVGWS